jgi:acetyl esterase
LGHRHRVSNCDTFGFDTNSSEILNQGEEMIASLRAQRATLRVRLVFGGKREPATLMVSDEALAASQETQNRKLASPLVRMLIGFPDRNATISWQQVSQSDRVIPVRVYRPSRGRVNPEIGLPVVIHVHGGGYRGTAQQCDWINSYFAARLPAVVVSVEHRLLTSKVPLSGAVEDLWDVLRHVTQHSAQWGVDPARVSIIGESAGATIGALTAIRAARCNVRIQAQVLINPCTDLTVTALNYPSMSEHADSPTLKIEEVDLFRRLAIPEGTDARDLSPLYADDLSGLAPVLLVVPTLDPLADQARAYAHRLHEARTPARLSEYPRAGHAFISMPGLVPAARSARREVLSFLRENFLPATRLSDA